MDRRKWQQHFFARRVSLKTTWKFRLLLLMLVVVIGSVTRQFWTLWIGQSLVCKEERIVSDGILIENFDPNYFLFERAEALQRAGFASRVFVPLGTWSDRAQPSPVSQGIAEVMARIARLPAIEFIPIQIMEPISLNAARQIRDFLHSAHVHSVLVLSPDFRSRRSWLVYEAVLAPAGIRVHCIPVFGKHTPTTWTKTWHGLQAVIGQWIKLQYYRFYVLPAHTA